MKMRKNSVGLGALTVLAIASQAQAYEFGSGGWLQKPGLVIGAAAAAPPPGLYGFDQLFTYQSKLVGPGAPNSGGAQTGVKYDMALQGFLWVPGWNFLAQRTMWLPPYPLSLLALEARITSPHPACTT